jgi:hypothetical protein
MQCEKDDSSIRIINHLKAGRDRKILNDCVYRILGRRVDVQTTISQPSMVNQRLSVIACAEAQGVKI